MFNAPRVAVFFLNIFRYKVLVVIADWPYWTQPWVHVYKAHWYVLMYVWEESCNRPLPLENPGQFEGKSGLRDSQVNFGTIPGNPGRLASMLIYTPLHQ